VVGASLDEALKVRCHVTADPGDVTFVWQFNNSGESFEVEQSRFGTGNGSTSDLNYTPKSERDYGTLACWGRNTIGRQADPCVFQLVPAGNKPSITGKQNSSYPRSVLRNLEVLDFRFSPYSESCMFSFGYFPGVRLSFADVS
jgi:hypothetical protein